jgi:predicted PolB exonuclease-like 3'-5' exonuclease
MAGRARRGQNERITPPPPLPPTMQEQMDRKLNEFLELTQGNHTVLQYAQAFNDLCQYAGYHADTDEKKRDWFRRGLSTKLRDRLNTVRANNYNELVNMAISQEDCITARQTE